MSGNTTCMTWSNNKGKVGAFLMLLTIFVCLYSQQPLSTAFTHPEHTEQTSKVYNFDPNPSLFKTDEQTANKGSNMKRSERKGYEGSWLFMETLKSMSTRELALKVLENCRLSNHFDAMAENTSAVFEKAEKLVSEAIQHKQYTWHPVYNEDDKRFYSYCLNTKTASTFLKKYVFRRGYEASKVHSEDSVKAVMVIREPMHRLLSAYLDKLAECQDGKANICAQWKSFARNIQLFVLRSNKTESNLFSASPATSSRADPRQISFPDFVDYIIHMFLRNDGKIRSPFTDVPTPKWTWWHWESVVMDRCFPCAVVWRDVVLFETMEAHLKQILAKYPVLFRDPNRLPVIKPSDTNAKVKRYFAQLPDKQLWFLGNVMYSLDYAVLPYDFESFLESIGRNNLSKS